MAAVWGVLIGLVMVGLGVGLQDQPLPFRIGLWISLAGWAALGALLGYSIRRAPPSQKIAAPGA